MLGGVFNDQIEYQKRGARTPIGQDVDMSPKTLEDVGTVEQSSWLRDNDPDQRRRYMEAFLPKSRQ